MLSPCNNIQLRPVVLVKKHRMQVPIQDRGGDQSRHLIPQKANSLNVSPNDTPLDLRKKQLSQQVRLTRKVVGPPEGARELSQQEVRQSRRHLKILPSQSETKLNTEHTWAYATPLTLNNMASTKNANQKISSSEAKLTPNFAVHVRKSLDR